MPETLNQPWWIDVIKAAVVINLVMVCFAYATWLERIRCGRDQSCVGHYLTHASINTPFIEPASLDGVTHRLRTTTALAAASMLAWAACGGSDGTDERTSTEDPQAEARDVHLSMVNNAYSPRPSTSRRVRPSGTSHNDGSVRHDAIIGDAATQHMHQQEVRAAGEAAQAADAMSHGPVPAITIEPGQTGELVHTFDEAGRMIVGCHEPGHYDAGMQISVDVA